MVQSTFWTLIGPGMAEEDWETITLLTSEVPSGYRAFSSSSKYSRLYSSCPSSLCSDVSMLFVFGRRLGAVFPVAIGLLLRELKREKPPLPLPLPRLGVCPLPPL